MIAAALLLILPPSIASPQGPDVGGLSWLAGCWSRDSNGRHIEEHWTRPAGGTLLGMGRTVDGARTVDYEHLLIHVEGPDVYYVAKPARQPEARFKLVHRSDDWRRVRFENPAHDFPQRITYELTATDTLKAQISGSSGGRERTVEFPMTRGCP